MSRGCRSQVILAGTSTGQIRAPLHAAKTAVVVCSLTASRRRTGCSSLMCARRARASRRTMYAHNRLLFQALFCRTNVTLGGHLLCNMAKSAAWNVAKLPMIIWGSSGCKSGLSHMNATCVKQHLRLKRGTICTGSSRRRFLSTKTVPLPSPWDKQIEVSSMLILKIVFPAGTCALQ